MTSATSRYMTAARFSVLEQLRNRTALFLLVLFVPAWFLLMRVIVPDDLTDFHLRSNDTQLSVNGFHMTLITAGLNVLTLIVGFMFFSAARRGLPFDRRLARSGFPRPLLIAARLTALLAASVAISLFTAAVLLVFWRPGDLFAVVLGFVLASVIYGAMGMMLGVVVRGELEGFFVIIMVSMIDTFLQNPIGNPAADKPMIAYFPTYGVMQFSTQGAFTSDLPWAYAGYAALWVVGFTVLALLGFWWGTRSPRVRRKREQAAGNREAVGGVAGVDTPRAR